MTVSRSGRSCPGHGVPLCNVPERHVPIPVKVLWRKRWVCVRCGRVFKKEPRYGW